MRNATGLVLALIVLLLAPATCWAAGGEGGAGDHDRIVNEALFLICLLVLGRCGALVERLGLPSVLGELAVGAVAVLFCRLVGWVQVTEHLLTDVIVVWVAQFGVNLLLFKTGLEESIDKMLRVGPRAALVAVVGVVCPGGLGYLLSMVFFADQPTVTHVFVGATLVATSVGITAKLFSDLKYSGPTRTLVIGAAVADDIIGLVIFAVVAAMAAGTAVSAGMVASKTAIAVAFIVVSVGLGRIAAPWLTRLFSSIHKGVGMKMAVGLLFCFGFGWLAHATVGLEPIIGAFCAGLLLEHMHFSKFEHSYQVGRLEGWAEQLTPEQGHLKEEMLEVAHGKKHAHLEHLVEGVGRFFIPVFFVYTGTLVDLRVFADPKTVGIALCLAAAAIVGKLVCGLFSGPGTNRWVVAWAMVARGEVGLVFAAFGKAKGVFTDEIFAAVVAVVVLSTFIPPILLSRFIRKEQEDAAATAK